MIQKIMKHKWNASKIKISKKFLISIKNIGKNTILLSHQNIIQKIKHKKALIKNKKVFMNMKE